MLMKGGEQKKSARRRLRAGGEMDVWLYLRAVETYF